MPNPADLESSIRVVGLFADVNGPGRLALNLLSTALASTWPSYSNVAVWLAPSRTPSNARENAASES